MYGHQIVDSNYVAASVSPINIPDENNRETDYYGYSWWLAKYNEHDVFCEEFWDNMLFVCQIKT